MTSNYYISSFFWTTVAKILNAALNFFSIPILMCLWGQANYGIFTLAIACNSYLSLIDLGLNTGAVRYFSIWISDNNIGTLHRVANSNTIFYAIISIINVICLLTIASFGKYWFNITYNQFLILKSCLIIQALFALPSWITTSFNQLLIANQQTAFTQKVNCGLTLLKVLLIFLTVHLKIELEKYFFFYTAIIALTVIPFFIESIKKNLYGTFHLHFYWHEFKPVLHYSIALFALSIFQMTATQSRPIILGIFSCSAADTLAEFKIIEVVPLFILTIGGSITSILLPKSSKLITENNVKGIERFAYKGTQLTSILACCLCFPFIIGSKEVLSAYVGVNYNYLSIWLVLWCITILFQIHTTPGGSLILAKGKTKVLVYTTATACVISIVINALSTPLLGVGSAVIGYLIYVIIVIGAYYIAYYKTLLNLSRRKMMLSFLKPTFLAGISFAITIITFNVVFINIDSSIRWQLIMLFIIKSIFWLIIYIALITFTKMIKFNNWKPVI